MAQLKTSARMQKATLSGVVVSGPIALPAQSRISRIAIDPTSKPGLDRVFLPTVDGEGAFYVSAAGSKRMHPVHLDAPSSGAAFLPNSDTVVVAVDDTLAFYRMPKIDATSTLLGKAVSFSPSSRSPIQSLAANSDASNPLIACGSRGVLNIIDVAQLDDPQVVNVFSRLPGNTWACAWSSDNKHLAFSAGNRLMVWGTNHQLREVYCADSEINAIAWSPSESMLVVGTDEAAIILLDTKSWTTRILDTPFQHEISSVAFSSSGSFLSAKCWGTSEERPGLVCVWKTSSWEPVLCLTEMAGKESFSPPSVGFLAHSDTLISLTNDDRGIREIQLDGFLSSSERAATEEKKRRKELIQNGEIRGAIKSLASQIRSSQAPLVTETAEMLQQMAGKQFDSMDEMKEFSSSLSTILKPLDMRVQCPSGKYAGAPARLSVTVSGRSKEPRFCYLVQVAGEMKSVTDHATGMRVPDFKLCQAPKDRRRKSFD